MINENHTLKTEAVLAHWMLMGFIKFLNQILEKPLLIGVFILWFKIV
ncbi:MAG: hypothetical protein V3V16_00635 [Melioribacteraceae bacterium]